MMCASSPHPHHTYHSLPPRNRPAAANAKQRAPPGLAQARCHPPCHPAHNTPDASIWLALCGWLWLLWGLCIRAPVPGTVFFAPVGRFPARPRSGSRLAVLLMNAAQTVMQRRPCAPPKRQSALHRAPLAARHIYPCSCDYPLSPWPQAQIAISVGRK